MILPKPSLHYIIALLVLCFYSCKENTNTNLISPKNEQPQAITALNEQIKNDPNNADLYHKRAIYYNTHTDVDAALMDMKRALMLDSTKVNYYLTIADIYFKTNKTRNAKESLEKCITIDAKNIPALLKLAELFLYVKQHQQAINYINKVLKIDGYNAKAYFMKGMSYKEIGDTTNAISSMVTAVEQDQTYYAAYIQLGILYAEQKNPLALDYYSNALKLKPNSIEALYNVAKFYQDIAAYSKALEAYNILLRVNKKYKYAYFNKGVIYLIGFQKYKMAIDCFDAAIKQDSLYTEPNYGIGVCYHEMGNLKQAKAYYLKALKINNRYTPAIDALNMLQ